MAARIHVPEEVVVEIMSWLPPDSLIRFKLVSKSWYALIESLISDPTFVSKHLRNMKNDMSFSKSLAFIYQSRCACEDPILSYLHSLSCPVSVPKICRLSLLDADGESDHIHHVIEDIPRIPFEMDGTDRLEYHCNGVVVLTRRQSGFSRSYFLYNPSIMEFRLLPELMLSEQFGIIGEGFGYDSKANDYKLIRFGYDWMSKNSRAVVYRLSTNSWRETEFDWSKMKFDLDIEDIVINSTGVFCKGVIYWHICIHKVLSDIELWSSNEILHDKLLSFNVSDEMFHGLPLPDNLQSLEDPWDPKWNTLAVWNESLAMFHYPLEREGLVSIEVWVMDESFGSWFKQLAVGPLTGIRTALTFGKGDELLLQGKDGSLVSYNLRSQKLRNLSIDGVAKKDGVIEEGVFPYVKSLVSVKGRRQHEN